MYSSSNSGSFACAAFEEYESKLKTLFAREQGNEIWCSQSERVQYPCISILVDGEQAAVNYFSEEGGDMAASLGDEGAEGSVEFGGGRHEIAAYQVISAASAMECALAFFRSQERPDCIDWEDL